MSIVCVVKFKVDQLPYEVGITDHVGWGFTPRETGRIRGLCGLAGIELIKALQNGDVEAYAAMAVVAMERQGVTVNVDNLFDGVSEITDIEWVDPTVDAAGDPVAGKNRNRTTTRDRDGGGDPA